MKIGKITIALCLLLPLCTAAQLNYNELKIGDTVPDIELALIDGSETKVKISDYRGQLLIIDCWSIYCAPCIKAFPGLAMLDKKLTGKVKILALEGGSPEREVKAFLKAREKRNEKIALTTAHIKDPKNGNFYKLFPILKYGFPVEIWIDPNGKLIGITGAAFVNEKVIDKVLKGDNRSLYQKNYQKNFDERKPFLLNNNGGPDSAFVYRSIISPFIDSIPSSQGAIASKTDKMTRLFFANRTPMELAKIAAYQSPSFDVFNKQTEIDVLEPGKYRRPKNKEDYYTYMETNGYCYEVILPPHKTLKEGYATMLVDIERFFGIKVSFRNKKIKCLIVEKDNGKNIRTKGGSQAFKAENEENTTKYEVKNRKIELLLALLNKKDYPFIVNRTQIDYPVDIRFSLPALYNIDSISKSFRKTGIRVREEWIEQKILVLGEQ